MMFAKHTVFLLLFLGFYGAQVLGQILCPSIYDPVCCYVGGLYKSSSNECLCTATGGVYIFRGNCDSSPSSADHTVPTVESAKGGKSSSVLVTKAEDTTDTSSFVDETKSTGEEILATTAPEPNNESDSEEEFECPSFSNPVCCIISEGLQVTKNNECLCGVAEGIVVEEGECSSRPSLIPTENPLPCGLTDPKVCCQREDLSTGTENNKCECNGTVLYEAECTF